MEQLEAVVRLAFPDYAENFPFVMLVLGDLERRGLVQDQEQEVPRPRRNHVLRPPQDVLDLARPRVPAFHSRPYTPHSRLGLRATCPLPRHTGGLDDLHRHPVGGDERCPPR